MLSGNSNFPLDMARRSQFVSEQISLCTVCFGPLVVRYMCFQAIILPSHLQITKINLNEELWHFVLAAFYLE